MQTNYNLIKGITSIALIILVHLSAYAKNLGVYGETFPIEEKDLKEVIYEKLRLYEQNGELEWLKSKFIQNVKTHAIRPNPVQGLTTTEAPETFYYDPTYVAKESVGDEKGKIIVKAGTKVNPLDSVNLKNAMLFFNADDPKQINWAKREIKKHDLVKIILVQGNIKKASKLLSERIYFDQAGSISRKLGLKHIPVLVTQAGKRLEVKEISINDTENETGIQGVANKVNKINKTQNPKTCS